jgi:hypothetical protein
VGLSKAHKPSSRQRFLRFVGIFSHYNIVGILMVCCFCLSVLFLILLPFHLLLAINKSASKGDNHQWLHDSCLLASIISLEI